MNKFNINDDVYFFKENTGGIEIIKMRIVLIELKKVRTLEPFIVYTGEVVKDESRYSVLDKHLFKSQEEILDNMQLQIDTMRSKK